MEVKIMRNRLLPLQHLSTDAEVVLKNYPTRDGYLLQLFRVFANSQRFLRKGVVNLLDKQSPLAMREREIVILRVCANNRCEYEWGVHVTAFSDHVGLTQRQVAATVNESATADCWNQRESLLLQVVDELCENGCLRESLSGFEETWNVEEQLEILALCGNYHTVSFVANTAHVDLESFAARFPG